MNSGLDRLGQKCSKMASNFFYAKYNIFNKRKMSKKILSEHWEKWYPAGLKNTFLPGLILFLWSTQNFIQEKLERPTLNGKLNKRPLIRIYPYFISTVSGIFGNLKIHTKFWFLLKKKHKLIMIPLGSNSWHWHLKTK